MLSGRSRRLPPPRAKTTLAGPAAVGATAAPASTSRRPRSPLRTHIHPFPISLRATAPGPQRLLALPIARATLPLPPAPEYRHGPSARARQRWRAWLRLALRALIPPALLLAVLVVPPQSLRATLVTLLIVATLGLVVWRLPMTDEE